ncbi:MAG TPA: superoxide dismutase [Cu-Zn] SodC [Smithellaceae bacterium]
MRRLIFIVLVVMVSVGTAMANEKEIQVNLVNDQGLGENIGTISVQDSKYGLILTPKLSNLPQGIHGFHIHQNPDCSNMMTGGKPMAASAAGGHFDPLMTGKHEGPYGNGHSGDLPFLYVDKDGKALLPVLAPRLKVSDLKGRSLMIHAGGDNYSDVPEKLGGGGSRLACGAVK